MEETGSRIRLREWRPGEVDAMHGWLGDPRVGRFLDWVPKDLEGSRRHLRECVQAQTQTDRRIFYLAIERLSDGAVLGDAGFEWSGDGSERSEFGFGYFLAHSHWGQGYATEAALLVLELGFSSRGADQAERAATRRTPRRNTSSQSAASLAGLLRKKPAAGCTGRIVISGLPPPGSVRGGMTSENEP